MNKSHKFAATDARHSNFCSSTSRVFVRRRRIVPVRGHWRSPLGGLLPVVAGTTGIVITTGLQNSSRWRIPRRERLQWRRTWATGWSPRRRMEEADGKRTANPKKKKRRKMEGTTVITTKILWTWTTTTLPPIPGRPRTTTSMGRRVAPPRE